MIVQSLNCGGSIQSSIANRDLGAEVGGVGSGHLMVSSCRAVKRPKRNIMKNGRKGDKTEEPKESKESSMQRRASARIQALQKVDKKLLERRKVELLGHRDDAGDGNNKSTPSKRSRNFENVGKEDDDAGDENKKTTPSKGRRNYENVGKEEDDAGDRNKMSTPCKRRRNYENVGKEEVDAGDGNKKRTPCKRRRNYENVVKEEVDAGDGNKKSTACEGSRNYENVGKEEVAGEQRRVKKLDETITEEPKESMESSMQRRASARIQAKQKVDKELLVRRRVKLLDDRDDAGDGKKNTRCKGSSNGENVVKGEVVGEQRRVKKLDESTLLKDMSTAGLEGVDSGNGAGNLVEKSDSVKVKETLRLFNKHYLHFVQEEEKRCRKVEADRKVSKKGSKSKKGVPPEDTKKNAKRPDLKAISKMMENNEILYPEKRIGNIPGIKVGHQFYSRAEMVAVGFHSHWLNGIDYMGQSYCKVSQYSNYEFPLAVAIVLSGMYEDDLDNAEDVVYTGQGGHNLTGDKRQIRDQVLERGNLALKNCVDQCMPVRVVRGHESSSSYCGKVYTYDGLYKVVNYWAEKGISGFTVYKFRLRRLDGQPTLTTNQVYFTNGRVPQSVAEIRGLVCEDITRGQEDMPIPATNLVDVPPVAPTGFTYCKSLQVSKNVKLPMDATGCKCKGICIDPTSCECALRNGSDFPYVSRDGGRLIEAKDVVFECGPKCGCGPGCVNRTSQRGLRYRLEVFRTVKKGWAVRSWDFIPSGAPVCEYTGLLMRTDDLENASENNFIFEIDCLQTMKGLGGRERRSQNEGPPATNLLDKSEDHSSESVPEYCIDAGSTGNIARFINHSCEPNLFVQCVLSSHHDLKLARVMLFAADNIPPLQELTYDYGYALDSVLGPDGKVKQMACYCGAADCKKRLF